MIRESKDALANKVAAASEKKDGHNSKIGLCLSGGGSRAIAYHLGCMRALNRHGLLEKVSLLSTVSGGSVIGAMYAYSNDSFVEFEKRVLQQLQSGFFGKILGKFLAKWSRTEAMIEAFDDRLYQKENLAAKTRNGIEITINACEVSTGTAFRFSNKVISNWIFGKARSDSVRIAEAVAASATYPVLLPVMNKEFLFHKDDQTKSKEVALIDGGVYENLGLTPLLPDRLSDYSYPHEHFDYIIACDAEYARAVPGKTPRFFDKFAACFSSLTRRIRSMNFDLLHEYKDTGAIKGFVLSCLSQEDKDIFTEDDNYIPYDQISDYPTDFHKMRKKNIKLLSKRGEQITDRLIKKYLGYAP